MEIASNSERSQSFQNTSSEAGGPHINVNGPAYTIHEEDSNEDLTSGKDFSPRHANNNNNNLNRSKNSLITSPLNNNNMSQNKSFHKMNLSQDMSLNMDFTKAANKNEGKFSYTNNIKIMNTPENKLLKN